MPAKEIKELRQAGKLEEAYAMAKAELELTCQIFGESEFKLGVICSTR
jgi:hypothetical protein